MTEESRQWFDDSTEWFVVRPGAQRKGRMITIPLMYVGEHELRDAEMMVFGDHINGMTTTEDGLPQSFITELGDLASGEEFRLIIHTDGDPEQLAFVLDFLANGSNLRKLRCRSRSACRWSPSTWSLTVGM